MGWPSWACSLKASCVNSTESCVSETIGSLVCAALPRSTPPPLSSLDVHEARSSLLKKNKKRSDWFQTCASAFSYSSVTRRLLPVSLHLGQKAYCLLRVYIKRSESGRMTKHCAAQQAAANIVLLARMHRFAPGSSQGLTACGIIARMQSGWTVHAVLRRAQ